MKTFISIILIILLSACAGIRPIKLYGNYYMIGDNNCRSASYRNIGVINCFNGDKTFTGTRRAMTDQEMQQYLYKKNSDERMMSERKIIRKHNQKYYY